MTQEWSVKVEGDPNEYIYTPRLRWINRLSKNSIPTKVLQQNFRIKGGDVYVWRDVGTGIEESKD